VSHNSILWRLQEHSSLRNWQNRDTSEVPALRAISFISSWPIRALSKLDRSKSRLLWIQVRVHTVYSKFLQIGTWWTEITKECRNIGTLEVELTRIPKFIVILSRASLSCVYECALAQQHVSLAWLKWASIRQLRSHSYFHRSVEWAYRKF
jgi:hypothetical protein